jgi:5'-nucleotidase
MLEWWMRHLELKVESKLHINDIKKVATSWIIQLRDWMKNILNKLNTKKIPLVIITANWLWVDSITSYLEYENSIYDNVHILWNKFIFWEDWYVVGFESAIVHVFNKDETCVNQFPVTKKAIINRKNVILLWDSLWDVWMIEWFEYDNLIKIGFLNDKVDELLESYLEKYDLVITWDSDMQFFEDLNII